MLKVRRADLDRDYLERWAAELSLTDLWNRARDEAEAAS